MKGKPSKLDKFAERLDEWFGLEKRTLAEVRDLLATEGCVVSCSRLSDWWQQREASRLQERLLGQITSGARQCKEVERAFAGNPAPELETIVKLHRVLAMQLATAGVADPALLEMAERSTRLVLEFAKVEDKRSQLALSREKFEFDAAKAVLERAAELRAVAQDGGLGQDAKVDKIRQLLFGELPGDGNH